MIGTKMNTLQCDHKAIFFCDPITNHQYIDLAVVWLVSWSFSPLVGYIFGNILRIFKRGFIIAYTAR